MSRLSETNPKLIQQNGLILSIIHAALAMGVFFFTGIAFFVRSGQAGEAPNDIGTILTPIAWGVLAVALLLAVIVPRIVLALQRKLLLTRLAQTTDAATDTLHDIALRGLITAHLNKAIAAAVPLEGSAFFALVVYLVGGSLPLVFGAAAMACAILAKMPTPGRLAASVDAQWETLDQELAFSR